MRQFNEILDTVELQEAIVREQQDKLRQVKRDVIMELVRNDMLDFLTLDMGRIRSAARYERRK